MEMPTLLRLSSALPRVAVSVQDILAAQSRCWNATTNFQAVVAGNTAGIVLWNPPFNTILGVLGAPTSMSVVLGWKTKGFGTTYQAPAPLSYNGTTTAGQLLTYLQTIPNFPVGATVTGNAGGPFTINYSATPLDFNQPPLVQLTGATFVGGTAPSMYLNAPALVQVFALDYTDGAATSQATLAYLTADPGYTPLTPHNNRRRYPLGPVVGRTPVAIPEFVATGVSLAGLALANVTAVPDFGVLNYVDKTGHIFLEPGTGLLLATNNAFANVVSATIGWAEFSLTEV